MRYDHYEFLVISCGLGNASVAFMDLMNRVFGHYLNRFSIVLIDNIFIYSRSEKKHVNHLRVEFRVLKEHNIFCKILQM